MPVLTMGNIANRCILYQQFAEGGAEEVGIPALWTEINKAELLALRDAPIAMCGTMYGWFEEQKKRDAEQEYQKTSAAEKEVFKQRMAEINEADPGDGETQPPTPTPVEITSNSCFLSYFLSFLCIFIDQRRRPLCWDTVVTNVTILLRLKMGPVLATEGELHQTMSRTTI